ncbi:MAG TPA: superoxide dismutase [Mycobacteriales bacterium]|nr:superoxide dismutase [Mycobacteriales bacterium]
MRRRLALTAIGAAVLAFASGTVVNAATAGPASAAPLPKTIALPDGYQPEGIATSGASFYVGSLADGRIMRGNVLTGRVSPFVPGVAGGSTAGLEVSGNLLFAAGAGSGALKVYDLRTGRKLAERQVAPAGESFINDVSVIKDQAFFTDSNKAQLYVLPFGSSGHGSGPNFGKVKVLPTPAIQLGTGFNANGIETTPDGRSLLVIQSNTGILWRVSPKTGAATAVNVGGADLTNGDGLLLRGSTLFVVRNVNNEIVKVALNRGGTTGHVTGVITDPTLDVPATIAPFGPFLYAANARFTTPPTPTTPYHVSRIP